MSRNNDFVFNNINIEGNNINTILSVIDTFLDLGNHIDNPNNRRNNDEYDLNTIFDECLNVSFDNYDENLQDKIDYNEIYDRNLYFDNFTVRKSQISATKYMLMNGLNYGYSIQEIISNLICYYSIRYPDENLDQLKQIIKLYGTPIIRRHTYRQNIFVSIFDQINDVPNNEENKSILSEEQFNKLPCFKFTELKVKVETLETKCSICNENYDLDDDIIELKCSSDLLNVKLPNHYFHKDCIHEWTTKHSASCPLCRTNIQSQNF
jgi:hypothetical protein